MEQILTLSPGNSLNTLLNFPANSVIVDNLTAQYLYFPSLGMSVPPYTPGYILSLPATTVASARFQQPSGTVAAPINASETAVLRFMSDAIPPSPFTGYNAPSVQHVLFSSTIAAGGSLAPTTFNLPSGTHSIVVITSSSVTGIQVTGSTTGASYVNNVNTLAGEWYVAPVFGADTTLQISSGATGLGVSCTFTVMGIPEVVPAGPGGILQGTSVSIINQPGINSTFGGNIPVIPSVASSGSVPLWKYAHIQFGSIAAGSSGNILSLPITTAIFLGGAQIWFDSTGATSTLNFEILDGNGTITAIWEIVPTVVGPFGGPSFGFGVLITTTSLTAGSVLRLRNVGTGASPNIRGYALIAEQ